MDNGRPGRVAVFANDRYLLSGTKVDYLKSQHDLEEQSFSSLVAPLFIRGRGISVKVG